jgi:AAA family ATP:ADP antiporter
MSASLTQAALGVVAPRASAQAQRSQRARAAPAAALSCSRSAVLSGTRLASAVSAAAPTRGQRLVVRAQAADAAPAKFLGVSVVTLKKIVPLGFMFFCILFNYTILRDTKDVLVVTAPGSGAEIIPFLKTWVNLPMAIGFMYLYGQMANTMGTQALFYTVIFPFIAFFFSFAFVMYPARDFLHPTGWCEWVLSIIGQRFSAPIAIIRNWTYCLFYVMAELWGSVVVSVLFWGFANQITTVDEAKQFYPLFGLGANVALIFSGRAVRLFSEIRAGLPAGVDGWGLSLKGLMGMVVVGGMLVAGTYWTINNVIIPSLPVSKEAMASSKPKKKKVSMPMNESLAMLAKSRYVRDLATLVVAYGISINLVEVTWKSKIKAQYPNPNDYSAFMGDFSTCTGTFTFGMMLVGRWIFKRFAWGVAAATTPPVLLITGFIFFALVLAGPAVAPLLTPLGLTPLLAAVYVGAAQNIFSKSAKYSLFDPCKEMAYIPLDEETKVKGKAAIDVVCNPLGKSGGALIQQFMILGFGSLAASTPYLGIILLGIIIAWLQAAASLNTQFTKLAAEDEELAAEAGIKA